MVEVIRDLERYWDDRALRYGDTPQGVEWGSRESQETRFQVLAECVMDSKARGTVVDVGCGSGDLLTFLKRNSWIIDAYVGVDISNVMCLRAKKKHPNSRFIKMDAAGAALPEADYQILSGTLNKRIYKSKRQQYSWALKIVKNMWRHCRRAVAFNMLSTRAGELKVKSSFAYDPSRILESCLRLTPWVVLRHDYMPHDFTIYMYRKGDP